jgi:hypothetical protein
MINSKYNPPRGGFFGGYQADSKRGCTVGDGAEVLKKLAVFESVD